jgi:hypothetical protein
MAIGETLARFVIAARFGADRISVLQRGGELAFALKQAGPAMNLNGGLITPSTALAQFPILDIGPESSTFSI